MPPELDAVRLHIREILLADWDPSDAVRFEAACGEYDAEIEPLYALIRSGAGEEAIMDHLFAREREIMCFPGLGKERLRRVARKLLKLRSTQG
ncbi:MAG TPA: hypothetical protein VGI81_01415 [Tepidisphaeraceae bacterium]|jgi:hypothetical protein